MKLFKYITRLSVVVIALVYLFSSTVSAFTQNDFDCTINGTCFYQDCGSNTSAAEANSGTPGTVYLLGDSIATDGFAGDEYKKAFTDGQWQINISAKGGRHISYGDQHGILQLDADKSTIAQSSAIVVALGTNDLLDGAANKARAGELLKKLKTLNTKNAPVFWVNVIDFNHIAQSKATNKAIQDAMNGKGSVINWFNEANSKSTKQFESGYHPNNPKDQKLLADLVYKAVSSSSSATGTQSIKYLNKDVGDIKAGGSQFGATLYGGGYTNNKWEPRNAQQGGQKPYDDNGNSRNGPLPGRTGYAELDDNTALGSIPDKTKLAITYKGKTIVAEKLDQGGGGGPIEGKKRAIDLWWETARLLDMRDSAVVTLRPVSDDTPVTPIDGSAATTDAGTGTAQECCPDGQASPDQGLAGGTMDDFVKAEAYTENAGKVTTGPKYYGGKYGFIQGPSGSYWKDSVKNFYPYASRYATADAAPESVQDAMAYVKFSTLYKKYKDLKKVAMAHFVPMSINPDGSINESKANEPQGPENNNMTPKQYAENRVLKNMKDGVGKDIKLSYSSAPDFAKIYKEKVGEDYNGSASVSGGSSDSSGSSACQCDASSGTGQFDVVLDPGHSPTINQNSRDEKTGLINFDYENTPEMQNAFTAATKIKEKLEKDGYSVGMTKNSADEKIDLSERAKRANDTKTQLLVTLHSNGDGSSMLMYPDSKSTRTPKGSPRKDGKNGLVYPEIASKSEAAAKKIAPIIAKDLGIDYKAKTYYEVYGTNGLGGNKGNTGNTPVQTILSSVPQVYSEVKQNVLPSNKFIDSMTKAIKETVQKGSGGGGGAATSSGSSDNCANGSMQSAIDLAMKYAWADGSHGTTKKKEYADAINKARTSDKKYYGGGCDGVDCGAFVTRFMRDSRADAKYNDYAGPTATQEKYMKDHPEKYKSLGTKTSEEGLQPGDIAINEGHTMMYVGPVKDHPEFKGNMASASLCDRAPSSSNIFFSNKHGSFRWYRLIGG